MKAFLVYNLEAGEGVVFDSESDAHYAATGDDPHDPDLPGVSCIAKEWRKIYGEDGQEFEIEVIDI